METDVKGALDAWESPPDHPEGSQDDRCGGAGYRGHAGRGSKRGAGSGRRDTGVRPRPLSATPSQGPLVIAISGQGPNSVIIGDPGGDGPGPGPKAVVSSP